MARSIVIVGEEADAQVHEVRARLVARGVEVLLWNAGICPGEQDRTIAFSPGDVFTGPAAVDGLPGCVWVRALGRTARSSAQYEDALRERPYSLLEQLRERRSLVMSMLRMLEDRGVPIVNPTAALGVAELLPWQLDRLRAAGVPTLATLVTNDPLAARAFVERRGAVTHRPLTGGADVRKLSEGSCGDATLEQLSRAPEMLQEHVAGALVRLYVLAGEVVAAGRVGREDDGARGHDVERLDAPPRELVDVATRATACLGLVFAGVDVIVGDERLAVVEVNPAPTFAWFDTLAGAEVAELLARYLAARARD
ncbi:MAG: ATP-grasp domain-containing protein [Myxococcales bacterium]|nr:ATP-grasp domain-containing protein [Myxococcales bacterium]MCB9756767.1 ATP-grasp domain-containing protein [Myxococcales bacterium]